MPRGVGLMAWAIRRSVFSSHAIWPNDLNTLRLMAWKHAIWPDYLNTLRLMAWKHAIWPTFLYSTSASPGEGAIYWYLSRQGKIAGDIHETKSSGLSLSWMLIPEGFSPRGINWDGHFLGGSMGYSHWWHFIHEKRSYACLVRYAMW